MTKNFEIDQHLIFSSNITLFFNLCATKGWISDLDGKLPIITKIDFKEKCSTNSMSCQNSTPYYDEFYGISIAKKCFSKSHFLKIYRRKSGQTLTVKVKSLLFLIKITCDFILNLDLIKVFDDLMSKLKLECFLYRDRIVQEESRGTALFFIYRGMCRVQSRIYQLRKILKSGEHFGELCLLLPDIKRVANVDCISVTYIYR